MTIAVSFIYKTIAGGFNNANNKLTITILNIISLDLSSEVSNKRHIMIVKLLELIQLLSDLLKSEFRGVQ